MSSAHSTGTPGPPAVRPRGGRAFRRLAERIEFVLVEPSHPGNVGAAARAIATMGFRRLCVVSPRHADVLGNAEAVAFASGATDVLGAARVVGDLDAALAPARWAVGFTAESREFSASVLPPRAMAEEVVDRLPDLLGEEGPETSRPGGGTEPRVAASPGEAPGATVAIVFGTERTGLSIGQAQRCQRLCSIETDAHHSSLNLAQAVQVAAFVLSESLVAVAGSEGRATADDDRLASGEGAAAQGGREPGDVPATHGQLEGLFAHLESTLVTIGFLDPRKPKRLMPRLRRLLRRADPTVTEVDILRGICTRILQGWPRR